MPAPCRALATSVRAQKCGMVMSVTTQIIFPYMSDARAPAMDVHMTPQDAGMARSFWLILSALLIGVNGYRANPSHGSSARGAKRAFREPPQVFFSRALASPTRALIHARDTPSPKAAGPHRPDRGLRGWPSGVLSPRHQRANIGRRGTWPLPGAAPAMVLSFSQRWRQ